MTEQPLRTLTAPASRRWQLIDDSATSTYTQGALALSYPVPGGDESGSAAAGLSLVRPDRDIDTEIPDPEPWAARFIQAVLEVVSSDRPLTQLARWTAARVYADLSRRRDRVARHRRPGQLRATRQHVATVHVWQPSRDSAEVAARVTMGGRSRAIAARLDFRRGRWLCTALTFG
ncbi:MAG TPA: Rv3235 family protein [Nocardioidaceae bacterium]|jgi:hypothetical protein